MKKFIFVALASLLLSANALAQGSRTIQSGDVTGALGYTPLRSIGGMTGPVLNCGSGILCTADTISSSAAGTSGQIQYNNSGTLGGFTLSGDATVDTTSGILTLATVNSNVGSFGSATACTAFTTNAKGLITAASAVACTPAIASVTGLGTGVATALSAAVGVAGAFVVNGGALGTPSSGNGSNLTTLNATQLTTGTIPAARTNGHQNGTATNDNAAAGEVGEFVSSTVLIGSAVAQVSGSPANLTSISLTAGDWDVSGGVFYNPVGSPSVTRYGGCIETTTGAFSSDPANCYTTQAAAFSPGAGVVFGAPTPVRRISIAATTTVYITTVTLFTGGTSLSAYGTIRARRVR